jgi:RimJ/RimL family protein N-acetyltransferase
VELAAPDPPLSDGVVALRVPSEQDLPAIERRSVDPEVVRWMGPSEHTARELLELNRTRWTQGTRATFSVCDSSDACVGQVWVEVDLRDSRRGSVGYWLLPEVRGNGFATHSVQLVSRWALGELGMARLSVSIEPSNDRSQGVAKRSGFVKEGLLRSYEDIGGRRVDCLVFSLVSADLSLGEAR